MTTRSRLAAIVTVLAVLSLPPAGVVEAQPTRAGAQAELPRLEVQISRLDEEFNLARLSLAKVENQIRDAEQRKAKADAHLGSMKAAASKRLVTVYRMGLPPVFMMLLTSRDVAEFQRRIGVLSQVSDWETSLVESLEIAEGRSERISEELGEELARRRAVHDRIAEKRRQIEQRLAEQRRLLARIDAASRPRPVVLARPAPDLPASPRARIAVETAYAQLGKPYRYGGSGPDSFDCSGLTMFSWGKAGVSLPHSSRAQYGATKRVDRGDLQPGDLVFFGRPIHHVGMYIGGGRMINAVESGEPVAIRSIDRRDYAGAGRPGV